MSGIHEVQQRGRSVGRVIRPATVAEALEALATTPGARPIAGGSDLLLELQRSGPGDDVVLVDVSAIEGFRQIQQTDGGIVLAGGVTHSQVVRDQGLVIGAPPLAQACAEVGSAQLRNRATIAGNVVTASPANDTISALLALGATVELSRHDPSAGVLSRTVAMADFFTGFRTTVCEPIELITSITVPPLAADEHGLWVKVGLRRAQAISVVHVGMVIGLDGDHVARARLALGSVGPTVVLSDAFADALVGNRLDPESITRAAGAAADAVSPISDGRATAAYRSSVLVTVIKRALSAIQAGTPPANLTDRWSPTMPTLSSDEELSIAPLPPRSTIVAETPVAIATNGRRVVAPSGGASLLDWIRNQAGLTGMKEGCAEGECGACTVLLDGAAVMSCLVSAAQADGRSVTTVEGLAEDDGLHRLQASFVDEFAVQCGFCIPGFLVAGARLLRDFPSPTQAQIEGSLGGNLCRCTGYYPIVDAIRTAAQS